MKYILLLIFISFAFSVTAQNNNDRYSKPKFNHKGYNPNKCLFPEFYAGYPKRDKDTTWKFECYDSRDSIINIDTVQHISDARYFSLFKSYTDSAHTYDDSNGRKQLLPASSIIQRYDRMGADRWMSIDYTTNKYTELKEYPREIVKTDTIITVDPITKEELPIYYKYYKVVPVR